MDLRNLPIIESSAIPEGEIRFIDMAAVRKRIVMIDEPRPMTFENELVGDILYVRVTQPAPRYVDLQTGKIITPKLSANSQPPPKG